ncbi:MAG TPA: polysaccharide biosynthesis tyrosine autokinase [Geminicoccaceae bacterium]|nr:polysaccharide biosynthesis tyrosine autokinase [Geminicoccus sp.]HMU50774.1 polysaccharide biosynthesis tyrosine autokinase [Geminicoccaceae bacterium]
MTRGTAEAHDASPTNDTVDLLGLFRVLWRRKLLVGSLVLLGTMGAYLYGKNLTPEYTAKSAVLIEPPKSQIIDVQAMMSGLTPDGATMATQIKLIQSRTFVARVMDDLKLFDDPEFNAALRPQDGPSLKLSLSEPFRKLLALVPNEWLITTGLASEPVTVLESEAPRLAREAAIDTFLGGIEVSNEGGTYLIGINYTAEDPQKAARIANRLAEVYVDDQLKTKLFATDRASVWLQERLDALKEEVRSSEQEVERYRAQNNLLDSNNGVLLNDQELSDLNRELITARADLAERQAKLSLVRGLRGRGQALDAIGEVVSSPVIVNLRAQEVVLLREEAELRSLYGERHPKMQQLAAEKANIQGKIGAEVTRITTVLENDVAVAAARAHTIESQLSGLKTRSTTNREAEVRLRELERQATTSRSLYEAFLARFKETREQQEIVEPDSRLVAIASPPIRPSTPGAKLFAAAGLLASGMIATILALLLDRLDRGLRSAREVEAALGLPTLALVPKLDKLKRGQKPYQYLMDKPLSAYTEAIRSIYMALKLASVDRAPKVVLVTSSLPEEGKTTIAVCLATFAARSHKRVLLIDLDLRHPSVHRELGWSVSHGLVEYLVGDRPLDEAIQHDLETGLHFLPVKAQTTNPTDLLESERLRALIETCRARYDYVIIDSAPLVSVTDSRLAALLADKTVFVIKWGDTVESAAQDGVQTLRDIGIDIAGAVLTQIDLKRHAQYHYADIGEYYNKTKNYYVN